MADGKIPKIGREGQSWRVRVFEGLDRDGIAELMEANPYRRGEDVLRAYASMMMDPTKIDHPYEVMEAAYAFLTNDNRPNQSSPFRHLLTHRITPTDIDAYCQETNRQLWAPYARTYAQELGLTQVKHPMGRFVTRLPTSGLHHMRSLLAFQTLAQRVAEQMTNVTTSRRLTVLYPGAGTHIAPLITAMQLMDENKIDTAYFTYTNIESQWKVLFAIFQDLFHAGILERVALSPEKRIGESCSEWIFHLRYKGKTITLTEAVRCSGERYYREADLQRADIVVIHDPGPGSFLYSSYAQLAQVLRDRERFQDRRPQLAVIEVAVPERAALDGKPNLGVEPLILPGPYGHCHSVDGLGEFKGCKFVGVTLPLDHPVLHELVRGQDLSHITRAIFLEKPQQTKEREETIRRWESRPDRHCEIKFPDLDAVGIDVSDISSFSK